MGNLLFVIFLSFFSLIWVLQGVIFQLLPIPSTESTSNKYIKLGCLMCISHYFDTNFFKVMNKWSCKFFPSSDMRALLSSVVQKQKASTNLATFSHFRRARYLSPSKMKFLQHPSLCYYNPSYKPLKVIKVSIYFNYVLLLSPFKNHICWYFISWEAFHMILGNLTKL